MLERIYDIVSVDVSADIPKGTIIGFKVDKYIPAIKDGSDSFTGDGTTASFDLSNAPVVYGTVTVTVDGTPTTVDVDHEQGVITFATAPASGAAIAVAYKYYAAQPAGVLVEEVTAGQSPATAKVLFFGEMYEDELASAPGEDVKAKLRMVGIFVKKRISA